MKNKFYSKLMSLALVFVLVASVAYAQDFNNTGATATYKTTLDSNATNNPILRMKSPGGRITATSGSLVGSNYTNKVPGTVAWGTGCNLPFDINPTGTGGDFYYTNLTAEGTGPMTFDGNVYLSGDYVHTGGTTDHTTNEVVFNFVGYSGEQIIAGDNNNGLTDNGTGYYQLVLGGNSNKLIDASTTVEVIGDFTQNASTNVGGLLTVDGTLLFNTSVNSNNIAFNDSLLVSDGGTVTMGASPSTFTDLVTNEGIFNGGTGNMTFDDFANKGGLAGGNGFYLEGTDGNAQFATFTQDGGALEVADGGDILVSNVFDVNGGTIDLSCTSTFTYNGNLAQTLTSTEGAVNFSYGNLVLQGTISQTLMTADGDVEVCNDFTTARELDMYVTSGDDFTLTMLNSNFATTNATANYVGDVEVKGKMKWTNLENANEYTFNNANTKLTFGTAPTDFTMSVLPLTNPNVLLDTDTDIQRKITGSFTGNGTITDIVLQWDAADEGGSFTGDRNKFRIGEGYSTLDPSQTLAIAGNVYDRTQVGATNNPRILTYTGSTGALTLTNTGAAPAGTQEFFNGDDFVLTATPMQVIAIANGRWTDPQTWDIGAVPTPDDDALIRAIVWTGDSTAQFGGRAWGDNELAVAINSITIGSEISTNNGAALIIGNNDNNMGPGEVTFGTKLTDNTNKITNNNTNAFTNSGEGTSGPVYGIWVRTAGVGAGKFTPVLSTFLLENTGSVVNNSIIEVGVCQ